MRRTSAAGIGAVVVAVAITACSGSDASSSAAASSSAVVCDAADELRTSLDALSDVQPVEDGTDAVRQAFASVKTDLAQLGTDARDEYAGEVDRVQADADAVQTAVDTAQGAPSAQTLGAVASAIDVLLRDARALVGEGRELC
jgi:hypothetical protein